MKYEVILLDADGTLFNFERTESYALKKLFDKYCFKEDCNVLVRKYKEINAKLWSEMELGRITSEELKHERFRRFLAECSLAVDYCEVSNCYIEFLSEGNFLLDGAEEICEYLAKKYKLVIITNGIKEVQYSRVEKSAIAKYIDYLVVSQEAGSQKPDKKIFEYTFKRIGHEDKSTALIIGDSLSSDIQGGINFGIDTCWYNPGDDRNKTEIEASYEIKTLQELRGLL